MSVTTHTLEAKFGQPHPFFDRWQRWLRPANDSSMMRWTHALAHKPSEFYPYIGVPLLLMLSAVVIVLALPFLLVSGHFSVPDVQALFSPLDSKVKGVSHFIGSGAHELMGLYLVMVLWSFSSWMPSRRSLWISAAVIAGLLAVQALDPVNSVVLAFSTAMGWFIDELIGCRPQLAKWMQVLVVLLGVGVFTVLNLGLGQSVARGGWALVIVAAMLFSIWYYFSEWSRKRLLDTSQAAVRAQASAAERERIGRDLHDLLGHTLSLITLKLELSRKLAESDPQRSRNEANEAETVARQALAQVRAAVTGMRATDLHGEIASAGLLLESSGVQWQAHNPPPLPQGIDTMLSLVLREAVTNIARHAQATSARLQFLIAGDVLQMIISDDGRGIGNRRGNGLTGMRERVEAMDGVLSIEGERGMGTQLTISVPMSVAQELSA